MSEDWDDLQARIKRNKQGVSFDDLARLLQGCGFVMAPAGSTSHRIFRKDGCAPQVSLKEGRPLPIGYVTKTLRVIAECCGEE